MIRHLRHWWIPSATPNSPKTLIKIIFGRHLKLTQRTPVSLHADWTCNRLSGVSFLRSVRAAPIPPEPAAPAIRRKDHRARPPEFRTNLSDRLKNPFHDPPSPATLSAKLHHAPPHCPAISVMPNLVQHPCKTTYMSGTQKTEPWQNSLRGMAEPAFTVQVPDPERSLSLPTSSPLRAAISHFA